MKNYGSVIRIKTEKIDEYKALHAKIWPEVADMIRRCSIRNYTIYLRRPENLLFSHFEYHGDDFERDMQVMASDPATQKWWRLTDPCQEALESSGEGEWWAPMSEVFHQD